MVVVVEVATMHLRLAATGGPAPATVLAPVVVPTLACNTFL